MWEEKLFHNRVFFFLKRYRQPETHAWWQSYLVPFGGGEKGKPQRVRQQGGNIPWAHSTCHLTPPPLFRHPPPFLRFQKPDAQPRRHGETLSPGRFRQTGGDSHLMLKEALVERSSSPVAPLLATQTKLPASSCRSTAMNLRLPPSWKRRSLLSRLRPSWSQPYDTSAGSLTSQRSMALRPCRASWDLGSLVNWMAAAAPVNRTGGEKERESLECLEPGWKVTSITVCYCTGFFLFSQSFTFTCYIWPQLSFFKW